MIPNLGYGDHLFIVTLNRGFFNKRLIFLHSFVDTACFEFCSILGEFLCTAVRINCCSKFRFRMVHSRNSKTHFVCARVSCGDSQSAGEGRRQQLIWSAAQAVRGMGLAWRKRSGAAAKKEEQGGTGKRIC